MKTPWNLVYCLLLIVTLAGCQKIYQKQYVVPGTHSERLIELLNQIAKNHSIDACSATSKVKEMLVCHQRGEQKNGAIYMIGARRYSDSYIVDLFAWGGPVYDEGFVTTIDDETRSGLENIYGVQNISVRDKKSAIPIEYISE